MTSRALFESAMNARAGWKALLAKRGAIAPSPKKPKMPRAASAIEERLFYLLTMDHRANGTPLPKREHVFHKVRKWRFDFAYPDSKIGIECEGGLWSGGRHNRALGMMADMEKYNAAALEGWMVLRFAKEHVDSGYALETILRCLDLW